MTRKRKEALGKSESICAFRIIEEKRRDEIQGGEETGHTLK